MTMRNAAVRALEEKNFQPLRTHSSPSRYGAGLEQGRVRATLGLGHRVAGEDLPLEEGMQVALLLGVGAVVGDDLGVPGVGRLAAEDDRRPGRAAEDLVQQRELELPVSLAAELGAEVGGPQALGPHLVLQRVDDGAQGLVGRRELEPPPQHVDRLHLGPHELRRPVQLRLVLRIGLELPGHGRLPSSSAGRITFCLWRIHLWTDQNDVASRIARQTLDRRGPDYTDEVRRLIDAGRTVMRRCGTDSRPRVADIVAEADLSNEGFYRHFASKDALVAAILDDGTERLLSYLAHQMAKESTAEGQVRCWVEGVLSQAADEESAATTLAVLWNAASLGQTLAVPHSLDERPTGDAAAPALRRPPRRRSRSSTPSSWPTPWSAGSTTCCGDGGSRPGPRPTAWSASAWPPAPPAHGAGGTGAAESGAAGASRGQPVRPSCRSPHRGG